MADKNKKLDMEDVFRLTFSTPHGKTMLYWIANECGAFADDPKMITPELMAFWHRLLRVGSVTDPAKAGKLMDHCIMVASSTENKKTRSEDE